MNNLALKVDNATKVFRTKNGPLRAVNHLSLEIPAGQKVALLGSNGAGKSTLFNLILDLMTIDEGKVEIFGTTPAEAQKRDLITSLLQTGGLLLHWTVEEIIRSIAALAGHSDLVDQVVAETGVKPFLSQKVGKCSGGQKQRLKLALALLKPAPLMLLDEPTAGMDPHARRDFWRLIDGAAQSGATVLYATHFLDEATQYAERIILMHQGRLIADGTLDDYLRETGESTLEGAFFALTDANN
ncbi:hypothetical protein BK816_08665 [Boudabousia tangfeifanii]|uniref:ABC transporter domain-containing protein n=1 Tax=Boudabousia tangfeifanii TaxID=1912795 RepID=A0A1D9MM12_9ACTO|nr:ABC transporter ATP-binding protein [Boudabousia tangfeifanii]AOZ73334.1 hypothetical protein BK816_08665 [Boudabousia tangfeifanii]